MADEPSHHQDAGLDDTRATANAAGTTYANASPPPSPRPSGSAAGTTTSKNNNKRPRPSTTTAAAAAATTNSNNAAAPSAPREFQRAYKACVPCRKRKARCEVEVPADGGVPGPPCTRCRRALRECVFTEERAWKKQRLMEESERRARRTRGDAPPRPSPPRVMRRASPGDGGDGPLAESMMRTVVASGNDALNLLFEAATREGAAAAAPPQGREGFGALEGGVAGGGGFAGGVGAAETELGTYATPGSNVSGASGLLAPSPVQLSAAAEDVLDLWKCCRFVRMGWFTAREAVTYVDL